MIYINEINAAGKSAVDDTILVKDVPATAGSKMLENFKPLFSAEAVERLEKSGYEIAGKANVSIRGKGGAVEVSASEGDSSAFAETVKSAKGGAMTKEGWLKELESVNELSFDADEKKRMQKILDMMGKKEAELEKTDTADVEAQVYVMPMTNVLRNDGRNQPFARKDLLEGAPQSTEDSWQVPRLVK